jgi:hypothetical protein
MPVGIIDGMYRSCLAELNSIPAVFNFEFISVLFKFRLPFKMGDTPGIRSVKTQQVNRSRDGL